MERLRTVYNRENPSKAPIGAGPSDRVWRQLQERFREQCRTGAAACIVTRMMKKPKAPDSWATNRYDWLSSDDIQHVERE